MLVVFARLFQVQPFELCLQQHFGRGCPDTGCGSGKLYIWGGLVFANQETTVGIQNISEFSCVGSGVVALLKYMCCANIQEMEFQISMPFDTITVSASSLL